MSTVFVLGVAAVLVVLLGAVTYSKVSRGRGGMPESPAGNPSKVKRTSGGDD